MAKGGGSARFQWLGADLLEGRLLLSHAAGSLAEHAQAPTSAHVAPPLAAPRPETEPNHTVAPSDNVEAREADGSAAAVASSIASKNEINIPLLSSGKSTNDGGDASSSSRTMVDSARYLQGTYRDEPVAWGLTAGGAPGAGPMSRHRGDKAPEVPEFDARIVEGVRLADVPGLFPAPEGVEALPSPERSDLLDGFLPADRAALDRAIDGLLDGLGEELSRGVEATTLFPSPVVWGFALAVLEVTRRRLRRRPGRRAEGEQDPDRGPSDGFLAFRG